MGYTCGRKHTEESLRELAKKYSTRTEFQKKDKGAYSTARNKGNEFFDSICKHMINGSYSTPQLICKKIMETLLGIKCTYNTKRIITPYELDIYFPEFKLAIEYNGKGWHESEDVIKRDINKRMLCDKKEITLIYIIENSRDYEIDVKTQLIYNLDTINKVTNNNFNELDINRIVCSDIYEDILKTRDINEIKTKIKKCSSIAEFQKKYISEYNFLRRNKKLELLNEIRTIENYSDGELLEKCKKISDYSDFLNNHSKLYHRCRNRDLLQHATSHMEKRKNIYKKNTNEELLNISRDYNMKSQIKKENNSLFNELIKRKIFENVVYNPDFVYKHSKTIIKDKKLKECFENSKKYDNYEDFKKDKILYNKCVNFKIIKKIVNTFPKKDINDIILIESKKYKNFKEFTNTIWYKKTKTIKGLIQKIKKENNWSFFSNKEPLNYIEKFPKIVEMINIGIKTKEIEIILKIDKNIINKTKRQMYDNGILLVGFNAKKTK